MYGLWPDGGLRDGKEATHCGRDRHQAAAVIDALSDLFILRGIPGHIRSDNGPEFVAMAVREVGLPPLEPRPPTSSEAVHGRTATVKASTRSSMTNCSTVKSFTLCKRAK